jgi:ATP-binding cassette subfamily B protein RaxB
MNHFVVLVKTTSKGAVIHDPARGKRFVSNKELDDNYTGVILQLSPTEDFAQRNDLSKLSLSVLWSKIRHFKRNIAKIIALSIVVQIVTLLLPYYNKIIVDDVMVSNDEDLLLALAIGFILLTIFEVFSRTLRAWVSLRLSTTLGLQISMNVMKHLLNDVLKSPSLFWPCNFLGQIGYRGIMSSGLDGRLCESSLPLSSRDDSIESSL